MEESKHNKDALKKMLEDKIIDSPEAVAVLLHVPAALPPTAAATQPPHHPPL